MQDATLACVTFATLAWHTTRTRAERVIIRLMADDVRITYRGKLALTTRQAARRYGIQPSTMRKEIDRLGIAPLPEGIDERTPLYDAKELAAAMKARPGKGANLRKVQR